MLFESRTKKSLDLVCPSVLHDLQSEELNAQSISCSYLYITNPKKLAKIYWEQCQKLVFGLFPFLVLSNVELEMSWQNLTIGTLYMQELSFLFDYLYIS